MAYKNFIKIFFFSIFFSACDIGVEKEYYNWEPTIFKVIDDIELIKKVINNELAIHKDYSKACVEYRDYYINEGNWIDTLKNIENFHVTIWHDLDSINCSLGFYEKGNNLRLRLDNNGHIRRKVYEDSLSYKGYNIPFAIREITDENRKRNFIFEGRAIKKIPSVEIIFQGVYNL